MGPILINNGVDPRQILLPNGQPARYTPPPAPVRTPAPAPSNPIRPSLFQRVGQIARQDVFNPIGNQISRDVQPIKALGADITGLVRAGAGAVTHNPVAEQNALNQAQNRTNIDLAPGKSFITAKEAAQGGTSLIKPIAKGVAENAPYFVGPEGAALAKTTAGKILASGGSQGLVNFLSSAAQQKLDTGKVNLGQAAKSAIPAAVAGAAIPAIKPALGGLEKANTKLATKFPATQNIPIGLSTKDVSGKGAVGKNVVPETPKPKVVQSTTSPMAKKPGLVRGVTASIKGSNQIAPEIKGLISDNRYFKKTNQQTIEASRKAIDETGLSSATAKSLKDLGQSKGRVTQQQISHAIEVFRAHSAAGSLAKVAGDVKAADAHFGFASEIGDKLAQVGTTAGQKAQIFATLARQTPEGRLYAVQRALKNAGIEIKGNVRTTVEKDMADLMKTKEGSPERFLAEQKLADHAIQFIPRDKLTAFLELVRAGLISGPTTAFKVLFSQPFSGAQSLLRLIPSAAFDATRAAITGGERTQGLSLRGLGRDIKAAKSATATKLKSGLDTQYSGSFRRSFEDTLRLGHHQTPFERGIFRLHGAIQKPTAVIVRGRVLAGLAKAQGLNRGLKGNELKNFVDNYIKNPPSDAYKHAVQEGDKAINKEKTASYEQALHEGEVSVNQQRTALGSAAGELQKFGRTKPGAAGPGMLIAPITRVPGAIGTNALYDYSGVKFIKDVVYDGIIKKGQNPDFANQIATDFGKAVVGAGGVMALGAVLGATGHITPAAAEGSKQAALNKAEGKPNGSINIPGTHFWITLGAMGPVGIELQMGAGYGRGTSKGNPIGGIGQSLAAGGQELINQPYVQGIQNIANALQNPKQFLPSEATSLATEPIPAFLSQTASGTDTKARQINYGSVSDVAKSKIPGLRETIPAQSDVLGGQNKGQNISGGVFGGLMGTLDAFRPSITKNANDPALKEIDRLVKTLPSTDSPAISAPLRTQSINGTNVKLNDKQLANYTQTRGQIIHTGVTNLVQTPAYKNLNDTQKASQINKIITAATGVAKMQVLGSNPKTLTAEEKTAISTPNQLGKILSTVKTTSPLAKAYTAGKSSLTIQKSAGNYTGWLSTAQNQLKLISQQLSTNPSNASSLSNEALTLTNEMAKYQAYGGFTKPSGVPTFKALSISGAQPQYVSAITQSAAKYGVDIRAALAVAAMEGLGGGVGDNGTSYGPFQLHVGGELPAGQTQAWAESPAGIDYAVQKISQVAKGLTGAQAIQAIVNSFEQPANPTAEINGALAIYNGGKASVGGGGGTSISSSSSGSSAKYPTGIPKNTQFSPITRSEKAFTNVLKGTQKKYSVSLPKSGKATTRPYKIPKSYGLPKFPKPIHGSVSAKGKVKLHV